MQVLFWDHGLLAVHSELGYQAEGALDNPDREVDFVMEDVHGLRSALQIAPVAL